MTNSPRDNFYQIRQAVFDSKALLDDSDVAKYYSWRKKLDESVPRSELEMLEKLAEKFGVYEKKGDPLNPISDTQIRELILICRLFRDEMWRGIFRRPQPKVSFFSNPSPSERYEIDRWEKIDRLIDEVLSRIDGLGRSSRPGDYS